MFRNGFRYTFFMLLCFALMIQGAAGLEVHSMDFGSSGRDSGPSSVHIGNASAEEAPSGETSTDKLVAHACGIYSGMTYTNSLQALDSNYGKGFRLFEADFKLTSDGYPVLLHDWNGTAERLINRSGKVLSLEEFKASKPNYGLVLLEAGALQSWLESHSDAYIIADSKGDSLQIFQAIADKYPGLVKRLIPQMGFFWEYEPLREMGYEKIILALYKTRYSDSEVIHFVMDHDLKAVSMTQRRAESSLLAQLKRLDARVYAHTVNSYPRCMKLIQKGVYGIYTDSITPARLRMLEALPVHPFFFELYPLSPKGWSLSSHFSSSFLSSSLMS